MSKPGSEDSLSENENEVTMLSPEKLSELQQQIKHLQLSLENADKEKEELKQLLTSTASNVPTHSSEILSNPNLSTSRAATSYVPTYSIAPQYASFLPTLSSDSATSYVPTYSRAPQCASFLPTLSPNPAMSYVPTYSTAPLPTFSSYPATSYMPTYYATTCGRLPNSIASMPAQAAAFTPAQSASISPTHVLMSAQTAAFRPAQSASIPPTHLSMPVQAAWPTHTPRKLQDLPEFSGLPEQWPMFSIAYKESTDAYNYTNLENLTRLQKALKGAAKGKVEAFLIHPDSIGMVMSTLEFHYGRPQILIRSQIAKVKAFPGISGGRITEIVNFSTMVSNLIAFLENAGATPHLCNPTLLDELVSKLPLSKREEWARYTCTNMTQYPSVRDFGQWLQNMAMYISIATEVEPSRGENAHTAGHARRDKIVKPSFTITEERSSKSKCVVCQGDHEIFRCPNFRRSNVDERWKIVKSNRLCFCCLRDGHNSTSCQVRRECGLYSCRKFHNRLLHQDIKEKRITPKGGNANKMSPPTDKDEHSPNIENKTSDNNATVTTIVNNDFSKKTLFKFLPVEIKGPKGNCKVMAFIDDGSKVSLIEEQVAKSVGLKGPSDLLSLRWIGGKTTSEVSQRLNVEISEARSSANTFEMRNVRTTKKLQLPSQTLDLANFVNKYIDLKQLPIEDYTDAVPQILIGMPHTNLVRPLSVFNLDEHFAVHKSNLGYILFGSNEFNDEGVVSLIDYEQDTINEIQKQVTEYFTLENFGVKPLQPVVSEADKRAEQILLNTTKKIDSQYETGLLWKKDAVEFQESYSMALKRLSTIENKMNRDEAFAAWYRAKINEYVEKSYARKLSPQEAAVEKAHTWYLPHFAVCNLNKGNKLRLVFDAAASINNTSFNSRLMKGPCNYQPPPLLSILFKFRQAKVGVCADIREMFHRVNIREEDQTSQRFLWRNGDSTVPPDTYVMRAMIFGSASSPCSAQYVKNMNAEQFRNSHSRAVMAITERHYVDDYVDSFDTVEEAISVAKDVVSIHKHAGFELRGFISNSTKFCEELNEKSSSPTDCALANMCHGESVTEKILGMFWKPSCDQFCFVLKFARVQQAVLDGSRRPTKSEVLSLMMSIFDPFGLLANIVIKSKILLQELWRTNIDWNMPIPDDVYKKWYEWYTELKSVESLKIPRCYHDYFTHPSAVVDLHIFVDASELAFSAVGYWRIEYEGEVATTFVAGKSRCSPLKPLSIPRLELQAAVLGVRLKDAIVSSHDVTVKKITFWSDSKTVISWIRSDCRSYKQFVAHRIAEILDTSEVQQWRWVPGAQNPADDATRLQTKHTISSNSRWITGPQFLKRAEQQWPQMPKDFAETEGAQEKRSKFLLLINEKECFLPLTQYSNYYKLLRVMSWVRRAVIVFKSKGKQNADQPLTAAEIKATEMYIVRAVQEEVYGAEIQLLKDEKPLSRGSAIYSLTPILDDERVLRLSGRIDRARCVAADTKRPIILPKEHLLTSLIVRHYHEMYQHQNQETICCAIRRKFWIPGIRQLVRTAKSKCQRCKNLAAIPKPPLMGQLPEDRLTPFIRPFSYTGVDYFGPVMVTIGRRHEKRWVALFTCLSIRAVHLELAKDLSADAAIVCLRNFMNRRGVPVRLRSDRGTNFVGANKEEFLIVERHMADECARRGIEWMFNTPANPAAGGVWERMVRSIKRVLLFTLKEKAPQVETLIGLLIEAENLVNSRPLTHLPLDHEAAEPLTPNHFLIGGPNFVNTPIIDKVCPKKQWHILQQMKQTFWKRWVLEYLPELTRRTKWFQFVKPLRIGDIVIICDDNESRGDWKRGIVVEIFPAPDGQVRSAAVKTTAGILRRPASKLAVLDVMGESDAASESRAVGC